MVWFVAGFVAKSGQGGELLQLVLELKSGTLMEHFFRVGGEGLKERIIVEVLTMDRKS